MPHNPEYNVPPARFNNMQHFDIEFGSILERTLRMITN